MGWTFEQLQKSELTHSNVTDIAFDGRDVWVADGESCYVYGYWDANSEYEYLNQNYYFSRNVNKLHLYATVLTGAVRKMVAYNGSMYLLKTTTIEQWNLTTRTLTNTFTLPQACQPVIAVGYNRLWVCSIAPDDVTDRQSLMLYDLINDVWTNTSILGRKQFINRDIIDGLDGYMYVTAMNDHAIVKVNPDGSMVSSIRINRHPYKLQVNQNKDVWVASDAGTTPLQGMISKFNQTTGVSTNFAASGGSLTTLWDDERQNKLWYVGGACHLGRLDKTTKDFKFTQGTALGFTLSFDDYGISPSTITYGVVTPKLTYDKWNGSSFDSVNVNPYLMFVSGGYLYAARLSALVRVNSIEVLGTAMISTKAQNYYGDFT